MGAVMTAAGPPPQVLFFDMDAAVVAEKLDYEEQLVAFVFQGLVNVAGSATPTVMFNAGCENTGLASRRPAFPPCHSAPTSAPNARNCNRYPPLAAHR